MAAERAAVGAALSSRSLAEAVLELVDSHECFQPPHTAILDAVAELVGKGRPVDPAAVLHQLTAAGEAVRTGGGPYLHTLMADAARRRYHTAGCQIVQLASDPAWSDEHPETAWTTLEAAATHNDADDTLAPLGEVLPGWIDRQQHGAPTQTPTGWADLDALVRIRPGRLIIAGARPGNGKTLLGVNMAIHVALRANRPVLVCSMEMDHAELTDRIVAAVAGLPLDELTADAPISEPTWERIAAVRAELSEAPLYVDDSAALSLARLRSRLRWLARREHTPALVVIDYLGLMHAPPAERREQQIAALSRGLKLLAREFAVPIVALSQLNRAPEARADKRPPWPTCANPAPSNKTPTRCCCCTAPAPTTPPTGPANST